MWSSGQGGTTLQLGFTQAPWEHTGAAAEQVSPQWPQWRASLARSTHAPLQVSQAWVPRPPCAEEDDDVDPPVAEDDVFALAVFPPDPALELEPDPEVPPLEQATSARRTTSGAGANDERRPRPAIMGRRS